MTNQQVAIAPDLFTWPSDNPQLIASSCDSCAIVAFPSQAYCSACSGQSVSQVLLPTKGTLWTWTIQGFMPKSPYNGTTNLEDFKPYGVGYVELKGGVRVETRLKEDKPEQLKIGMAMELVIEKFRTDEQGQDVMCFAFQAAQ